MPGAALALVLIHLDVDGYRWQMVPAYVMVLILFVATLKALMRASL